MPRGVYDRSKSKKNAASATESKPAEKKARAPWGSKKAAKTAQVDAPFTKAAANIRSYSLLELASLRSTFTSSVPNHNIVSKIDTLIVSQLDELLSLQSPAEKQEAAEVKKAAQAPAPVQAPAPIQASAPFNPVVPANGQA